MVTLPLVRYGFNEAIVLSTFVLAMALVVPFGDGTPLPKLVGIAVDQTLKAFMSISKSFRCRLDHSSSRTRPLSGVLREAHRLHVEVNTGGALYSGSFTRNRAIDALCSSHTRDSSTPRTAAISFRFMPCS